MKLTVACLAATAALASFDGRAELFASIGGGASDWPSCGGYSCDRKDGAWFARVGAGIPLVPFLGVEARYVDLRRFKYKAGPLDPRDVNVEGKGAGVGAVFTVPTPIGLSVSGVAGLARMKNEVKVSDAVSSSAGGVTVISVGFSGSETHTKPYYGVGVDYRLGSGSNLSVGAEATRYKVLSILRGNVDTYTVSLTYRFF